MHRRIWLGLVVSWALCTTACSDESTETNGPGDSSGGISTGGGAAIGSGGTNATGGENGLGGAAGGSSGLAITGNYVDDYGFTHVITDSLWTMAGQGVFHITVISNPDQYLIAQNDAANQYSPNLWSRMDWFRSQGTLYYCQTRFDAESEAAALATAAPDNKNLTDSCNGFAWTILTPQ